MMTSDNEGNETPALKRVDDGYDDRAVQLVKDFADRIQAEHMVIGQRMTWIMALDSFLISGAAILAANNDKFDNHAVLAASLTIICMAGAGSNASCLFSNYWAGVAIREAANALATELDKYKNSRDRLLPLMRIYGRDPKNFAKSEFHISEMLHLWFFLPALFTGVFLTIGLGVGKITDQPINCWNWLPVAFIAVLFGPAVVYKLFKMLTTI